MNKCSIHKMVSFWNKCNFFATEIGIYLKGILITFHFVLFWGWGVRLDFLYNAEMMYLCFTFLHILRELLMLVESHFGRALFAGTQNDYKPLMGYFGHGSGRLLNESI